MPKGGKGKKGDKGNKGNKGDTTNGRPNERPKG